MKVLVLLLLCVGTIYAIPATIKFAGSTKGAPMFAPPMFDTAVASCAASSYQSPYVAYNATLSEAGVWQFAAMAEYSFKYTMRIYVYAGFNPMFPCANRLDPLVYNLDRVGLRGGPVVNDFLRVPQAGTYQVVVTGSSQNAEGIFVVNIIPSAKSGSTVGGKLWSRSYTYFSDPWECYTERTYPTPFQTYTWRHSAGTGYFDLYAALVNTSRTATVQTYAAIFEGNVSSSRDHLDPCNNTATGAIWKYGQYHSSKLVVIPYQHLIDGVTYTILVSGRNQTGYYGIQVVPTKTRFLTHSPGWTQPIRQYLADYDGTCEPSIDWTNQPWDSFVFTAENSIYLIDEQRVPDRDDFYDFDSFSFLYAGQNTATPPVPCPAGVALVDGRDTGDLSPVKVLTTPGSINTVVVSTYYRDSWNGSPKLAYMLHVFTGVTIRYPQVCGNGIVEPGEQCDSNKTCCDPNTCTIKPTGFVCRASTSICDPSETCNGLSEDCPAEVNLGTYTTQNGQCMECPVGTYSNVGSPHTCEPCPGGTYTSTVGSSACTLCGAGKFSRAGASVCLNCASGYYTPVTGSAKCIPCPAGKRSSATKGSSSCASCLPGTFSIGGVGACVACSKGFFAANFNEVACDPCPANTFTNVTRSPICKLCNAGQYSKGGATVCLNCPTPQIVSYAGAVCDYI